MTLEYKKSKVERLPRIPLRNFWEEDEDVDGEREGEDEADRTNNPPNDRVDGVVGLKNGRRRWKNEERVMDVSCSAGSLLCYTVSLVTAWLMTCSLTFVAACHEVKSCFRAGGNNRAETLAAPPAAVNFIHFGRPPRNLHKCKHPSSRSLEREITIRFLSGA